MTEKTNLTRQRKNYTEMRKGDNHIMIMHHRNHIRTLHPPTRWGGGRGERCPKYFKN